MVKSGYTLNAEGTGFAESWDKGCDRSTFLNHPLDLSHPLRKLKRQFDESQKVEFFCQPVNYEIPLDILVE